VEVFTISLPPCLPYVPPHCTVPVDPSAIHYGVMAYKYLDMLVKEFDNAIKEACRKTLKPKHTPDPRGAAWWNKQCIKHTSLPTMPERVLKDMRPPKLSAMPLQMQKENGHMNAFMRLRTQETSGIWQQSVMEGKLTFSQLCETATTTQ